MSKVAQDNFPRSINQHVPLMEFAADVVDGKHLASLGAPSTADPDGILATATIGDGAAHTFTSANWATTFDGSSTHVGENVAGKVNSLYGRCLTYLGDGSTDEVITTTGRDYLGQIMSEVVTLNGAITLFGQKAFAFVDTIGVSSSSGGSALSVGWSDVLGLPYRATQLLDWREDNVSKGVRRLVATNTLNGWILASDASLFGIAAPVNGFISGAQIIETVVNSSGTSVATFELGGTAVAGLTMTQPNGGTVGDVIADFAVTFDQGVTGRIAQSGQVECVSNVGGTAGAADVLCFMDENVLFVDGDTTTPSTTTSDTRGLVRAFTPCDASVVFECYYAVLTSNLHGLVQA